jgi:hypothetical protein
MEYTEVLRAKQGLCTVVIQSCANELMHLAVPQIFTHKYSYTEMENCAIARYKNVCSLALEGSSVTVIP